MDTKKIDFESIVTPKLEECIEKVKNYIAHFSLIPILEKAFINDNFIYKRADGSINEDYKLSLYVGELFLTYQNGKKLPLPSQNQSENIFNTLLELVRLSMSKEMFENSSDVLSIDYKVLFKYTERSFYIPIMVKICESIIDKKWLSLFYSTTGFYFQDIFTFNFIYKDILFNRFEKRENTLFLFDFEELLSEFKNIDNSITEERLHTFITFFSSEEANNTDYLPSVDNPLMHKPIIHIENQLICCDSLILIKDCFYILENLIKGDEKLFTEYGTSKGKNFEKTVLKSFEQLFPGSTFYTGLEYITPDQKLHETDLLIDTGNYLLIVESKGRSFQEKAKKGNYGSYKRSIKNTIEDAHEQCKYVYNYLNSNKTAIFKKNDEEYSFSKDSYFDVYLMTVELDNLDTISSDIYKTLDVFESNPIITFSLYDLFIINDILERGSIFLNYLEQRRGVIKQKKITSSTELDYLSYFIHTGLFYDKQDEMIKNDYTFLSIGDFSDDIDKYYFGETKDKPHYQVTEGSFALFEQLNKCNGKLGFTIEKEFLTANLETQKNILSGIEMLKGQSYSNGKSSVLSFVLESNKMGISIICFKNLNMIPHPDYFKNYIHNKQSTCSVKNWFFIVYSLLPYKIQNIILEGR